MAICSVTTVCITIWTGGIANIPSKWMVRTRTVTTKAARPDMKVMFTPLRTQTVIAIEHIITTTGEAPLTVSKLDSSLLVTTLPVKATEKVGGSRVWTEMGQKYNAFGRKVRQQCKIEVLTKWDGLIQETLGRKRVKCFPFQNLSEFQSRMNIFDNDAGHWKATGK